MAVRIGVIGYGYRGPNLVRNLAQTRGAQLAACSDLDQGRLELVRSRYPSVRTTTDYRDLAEDDDIDAIVSATPVSTHYHLAKEALEAGKHVLVEKWSQTARVIRAHVVRPSLNHQSHARGLS